MGTRLIRKVIETTNEYTNMYGVVVERPSSGRGNGNVRLVAKSVYWQGWVEQDGKLVLDTNHIESEERALALYPDAVIGQTLTL